MPTDDVRTLIAEMRAKADAMPEGPYDVVGLPDWDAKGAQCGWLHYPCTENGIELDSEEHVAYFATLDPAIVRALLDVVEMAIETNANGAMHLDVGEDGEMLLHNLSEAMLSSAIDDLYALAAERVAS